MAGSSTLLAILDGLGAPKSLRAWLSADSTSIAAQACLEIEGATVNAGNPLPVTFASQPLPTGAAADGVDITGSVMPTGGVGIRGWLSASYTLLLTFLGAVFSVKQPDVRAITQPLNPATLNAALAVALANGANTFGAQILGLTASGGAILTLEYSKDGGTTWNTKIARSNGQLVSTFSADGAFSADIAGLTNIRLRVSTVGTTGTIEIAYSISVATGIISLGEPLPPGTNTIGNVGIVAAGGGIGTDESANPPTQLTQLKAGTVSHPGQLYVQNQSANPIQLWLQGATCPILLASGGSANAQGADWQASANMPWFVGTYTINGTSGSQFYANSN